MIALQAMLNERTHRDLELIARAHKIPFTRREPKAQGLAIHVAAYSAIRHRTDRTTTGDRFTQEGRSA